VRGREERRRVVGANKPSCSFLGDGEWEIREIAVPEKPAPGGAIVRVEAVGMCHSDIDQLCGIVHTSRGGAYPTVPGHEIVGRIEQIDESGPFGVNAGDRVAVHPACLTAGNKRRLWS
jgi:D-arabinose 1-dehydrogenase-like Zn-dependent alcohol dehydrogenase